MTVCLGQHYYFSHSNSLQSATAFKLKRGEQVGKTLRLAVEEIEGLVVSLLEQSSAANDQANFVKRLRIMSAAHGL